MAARVLVALAVAAIAAIVALYLAIIFSQGGGDPDMPLVVPFVTAYLALMAILLATSLVVPPATTAALRAAAAAGLLVMAVLAAFSIGVAVLIAAGLAIAATVLALRARPGARSVISSVAAGLLAVIVLVGGLEFTGSYIVCPSTGESGGTTASFLGAGASYECKDGVLTTH